MFFSSLIINFSIRYLTTTGHKLIGVLYGYSGYSSGLGSFCSISGSGSLVTVGVIVFG